MKPVLHDAVGSCFVQWTGSDVASKCDESRHGMESPVYCWQMTVLSGEFRVRYDNINEKSVYSL